MTVEIEDASVRFLSELCEIEKQCFREEAFSKQQIGYLLEEYNSVSLAARVNGEIVGFIIGQIDIEQNHATGHVLTLDVAPTHRRKGIAKRLLNQIETIFRTRGIEEIRLEVREGNEAALNLYFRLGYRKIAMLKNYYPRAHGLYLRKVLK